MVPFHTLLYFSIIIVCAMTEYSIKVNTESLGKKIGLALIIVGSIMEVANVHNPLVPMGVFVYFGRNVLMAYLNRQRRRASDVHSDQRSVR